ncbi:MAG: hypothetical protein HP043_03350 [Dialister sp.]|nr:hypothetical protein [Dialister sp.]
MKVNLFIFIFICSYFVFSSESHSLKDTQNTRLDESNEILGLNEEGKTYRVSKAFWENQLLVSATVEQRSEKSCLLIVYVYNESIYSLITVYPVGYSAELFNLFNLNIIEDKNKKMAPLTIKGKEAMNSSPISSILVQINARQQKEYRFELTDYYKFIKDESYSLNLSGSYTRNKKTVKFNIDNLTFIKQ